MIRELCGTIRSPAPNFIRKAILRKITPANRRRSRYRRDTIASLVEQLEARTLLSGAGNLDFGDAPDSGPGTGTADYNTTDADGGPAHVIGTGFRTVRIGASVDGEMVLLDDFLGRRSSLVRLVNASAINDAGEIAGKAIGGAYVAIPRQ